MTLPDHLAELYNMLILVKKLKETLLSIMEYHFIKNSKWFSQIITINTPYILYFKSTQFR